MKKILAIAAVLLLSQIALTLQAAIPPFINYQGRLTDSLGIPIADGVYDMIFTIYDNFEGGSSLWSSGTMPVSVENGLFNVQLGILGTSIFTSGSERFLGIQVGSEPEMTPRTQILMAPYAVYAAEAGQAGSVTDGSIYDDDINDLADIDRTKIQGTAAILEDGENLFWNDNIFQSISYFTNTATFSHYSNTDAYVNFYDSTMRIDRTGIRIGNAGDPEIQSPLIIERHYNIASPNSRYGGLTYVYNAGTGTLFGTWSKAQRTSATATTKYTYGVYGYGTNDNEVGTAIGVFGYASGGAYTYGVYGDVNGSHLDGEYAGYFMGDVAVQGQIIYVVAGYRIDHPLDPENKYLFHSNVESPDMKNVYDGVVTLDANGSASVALPDYFEALNRDFRYQLTCIGGYAPVYIAEEIDNNRFMISGGEPGMKVSWMVTGIRKDPAAESRRILPEREKPAFEQGLYLYPEGYGYGDEKSINYEAIRQAREAAIGGSGE
jgi:hypothetical protein